MLVRQITEETTEVVKMIYPERVFARIEEQVDVPIPQVVEQIGVPSTMTSSRSSVQDKSTDGPTRLSSRARRGCRVSWSLILI